MVTAAQMSAIIETKRGSCSQQLSLDPSHEKCTYIELCVLSDLHGRALDNVCASRSADKAEALGSKMLLQTLHKQLIALTVNKDKQCSNRSSAHLSLSGKHG